MMHYPSPVVEWSEKVNPNKKLVKEMVRKPELTVKLGLKPWSEMSDLAIEPLDTLKQQISGCLDQPDIEGVATKTSPTLAAFNNKLYAAWIGKDSSDIYWAFFDD